MSILRAHMGARVYRVNPFMTQHKGLSVCPTTHPISFLPICSLVANSLEYFLVLTSEMHRDSWVPVLLLCFTKMLQLNELQVRTPLGQSQEDECPPYLYMYMYMYVVCSLVSSKQVHIQK